MKKIIRIAALVMVLTFVLCGCGEKMAPVSEKGEFPYIEAQDLAGYGEYDTNVDKALEYAVAYYKLVFRAQEKCDGLTLKSFKVGKKAAEYYELINALDIDTSANPELSDDKHVLVLIKAQVALTFSLIERRDVAISYGTEENEQWFSELSSHLNSKKQFFVEGRYAAK